MGKKRNKLVSSALEVCNKKGQEVTQFSEKLQYTHTQSDKLKFILKPKQKLLSCDVNVYMNKELKLSEKKNLLKQYQLKSYNMFGITFIVITIKKSG